MSNITIRKDPAARTPAAPPQEWDPGRWMRSFFSFDPFREMAPWANQDEALTFAPAFEVKETKDGYLFKVDVPGVKQEDIEVHLTGNRITIAGKREAEKRAQTETYYTYERSYGSFTRAFTLPDGVDGNAVVADMRDGVLTVNVPKRPEVQPKKIPVNTPQGTKS